MASGIQYLASGNLAGGTTTLYTVPAGISHAVVHVYILTNYGGSGAGSGTMELTINDQPYYANPFNQTTTQPLSASLMLSPGDYIKFINNAVFVSTQGEIIVSSYEVP